MLKQEKKVLKLTKARHAPSSRRRGPRRGELCAEASSAGQARIFCLWPQRARISQAIRAYFALCIHRARRVRQVHAKSIQGLRRRLTSFHCGPAYAAPAQCKQTAFSTNPHRTSFVPAHRANTAPCTIALALLPSGLPTTTSTANLPPSRLRSSSRARVLGNRASTSTATTNHAR